MIDCLSKKVVDWLIRTGSISEKDREIYFFGIHQGIISGINYITTFVIAASFHMLLEGIVFILVYKPLRSYAGGYHSRTELGCYLMSAMLTCTVLSLCKIVKVNYILFAVAAISVVIIWVLAPIEDSNKPLNEVEQRVYAKYCKRILCLELIVFMFSKFMKWHRIVLMMSIAIVAICIMVLCGYLRNMRIKSHFEGSVLDPRE